MTLEYSTSGAVMFFLGALFLTILIILITRQIFQKKTQENLTEKYKDKKWESPLTARTKYPDLNVFTLRGTFLSYGLLIALGLMIVAFSWTTYEQKTDLSKYIVGIGDEIEMETPRTAEPPPPPPPPPSPTVMTIVESDIADIETIEFEDMSISEDTDIDAPIAPPKKEVAPPPPPPPPVPKTTEKEIFKIVEEHPTFPGCEDVYDKKERQKCASEKMLAFIYENIQYPPVARENNIKGMVVLQFVVEIDGSVSNVKVVRDIGGGCGEEAMRVVKMMPAWNPGKQRGRPVRVMFTLPIKFLLT
ncbi:MAG TPA: energy transducer TonB [Bacteroidetes bacterium]|nr:energy transducer TonB [Bacteroidota bacterium]